MKEPRIYLIRHGETAWSKSGQHTGLTDLVLTSDGIEHAKALRDRLHGRPFDHVFCSPLKRAHETCKICGYAAQAIMTEDLYEWNYGDYEGHTSDQIQHTEPDWNIFSHGGPNGESTDDILTRTARVIDMLAKLEGDIAFFSSGHFSRAFTVRWLEMPLIRGRNFQLSTASLSVIGWKHGKRSLELWNDTSHINPEI